MKKIKKNLLSILLGIVFVLGLGMLAYPTFANWWNSWNAAQATGAYIEQVDSVSQEKLDKLKEEARDYNQSLISNNGRFNMTEAERSVYQQQLSIDGNNIMGTVSIPQIKVNLPIYHGTSESVLAIGAGHLEGSSLPVGGLGTHAVITGHRGLPSAKLFTDLDQLTPGDYVIVKALNETLTYQLDSINIVLPSEVENLNISPEEDLLTLVTCTPYGVNSHRMLLTGHRVENLLENLDWNTEAKLMSSKLVALFIAVFILIVLFIGLLIRSRKSKNGSESLK